MIQNNDDAVTKSTNRKLNLGLVLTILNVVFCLFVIGYVIISGIGVVLFPKHGAESGWFLFIIPVLIVLFFMLFMPDFIGVLFAVLYNKKKNKIYLLFLMIFMFIGAIVINTKLGLGLTTTSIRLIYSIFKIIIFIYYLIRFIVPEKEAS